MSTALVGSPLMDREHHRIGKIADVIPDPVTLHPEFLQVKVGMLGRTRLVPIAAVNPRDEGITVDLDVDEVKHAPQVQYDASPTSEERAMLYEHYHLMPPAPTS